MSKTCRRDFPDGFEEVTREGICPKTRKAVEQAFRDKRFPILLYGGAGTTRDEYGRRIAHPQPEPADCMGDGSLNSVARNATTLDPRRALFRCFRTLTRASYGAPDATPSCGARRGTCSSVKPSGQLRVRGPTCTRLRRCQPS